MERVTPQVAAWWKQRIGADAYMQFEKGTQEEIERVMEISAEDQQRMLETSKQMAEFMGSESSGSLMPSYVTEARDFSIYHGELDPDFYALWNEYGPTIGDNGYLGAWRGFFHNLDHAERYPTWVAYVSSEPVERDLHETPVTSPSVKMAMTITEGNTFYSPLGIFRSPIAIAHEEETGQNFSHLSMRLHGAAARFMSEIQPQQKYMIVRPLGTMKSVFAKSGIPFSSSDGSRGTGPQAYIRCTDPIVAGWCERPDVSTEEKSMFGESRFVLIEPSSDQDHQYHRIGSDHWFSQSPFLGGMSRKFFAHDSGFPFVTVALEELMKF